MLEKKAVYKCEICGNIIEGLWDGKPAVSCCDQAMTKLEAGTVDAAVEKHVPVIEKTADGYRVSVGSVPHPMEEKHYIEWIELIADGKNYTQFLKPGDTPVAEFKISASKITAREYCNLHGLWKAEN